MKKMAYLPRYGLSPPVRGSPLLLAGIVEIDCQRGLSPPVRGSPMSSRKMDATLPRYGSIPARAGKPYEWRSRSGNPRVYPRPCGEAFRRLGNGKTVRGLSPPVRGSPRSVAGRSGQHGSIPARAGKPLLAPGGRSHNRVYPRPCGEAVRVELRAG